MLLHLLLGQLDIFPSLLADLSDTFFPLPGIDFLTPPLSLFDLFSSDYVMFPGLGFQINCDRSEIAEKNSSPCQEPSPTGNKNVKGLDNQKKTSDRLPVHDGSVAEGGDLERISSKKVLWAVAAIGALCLVGVYFFVTYQTPPPPPRGLDSRSEARRELRELAHRLVDELLDRIDDFSS